MARGGRRTYTRDANGRFSSAPGGGGGKARRPAARKAVMRSGNRLTRDNRGRITSIGGDGATARGGRLRTAGGGMRARQTAALKAAPLRGGTIAKGGRGVSGKVARSLAAVKRERAAAQSQPKAPARARVGARKISDTKAARIVARVDARRPASQTASSSARRNQNALRTYQRATEFLLSPSRRALKRGSQISTNESVRRAVANAKPKSAKPAASPRASTGRSRKQAATQSQSKAPAPKSAAGRKKRGSKPMTRGLDSAKVGRILSRVTTDNPRRLGFNRKGINKSRNFTDTRLRAMAFLAKAAGGKNVRTLKGTRKVAADFGDMTRERLLQNAATKIRKSPKRSTKKSVGNVVAERTKRRKQVAAEQMVDRYGYGKAKRQKASQTLRVAPPNPARAAGQGQVYSFDKSRPRRSGDPMVGPRVTDGGARLTQTVVFTGRKSIRTKANAAKAQAKRRQVVGRLAGTARLGGPVSQFSRGKAKQLTLMGGSATTYGKLRRR